MKKTILAAIFAAAIAVSGAAGFASRVNADPNGGNTVDTEFSFYNMNSSGHSVGREKRNTTKVYVYPYYGPSVKYNVEGYHTSTNTWMDRSNSFVVSTGTQASLTNFVYENGEREARLGFVRQSYAGVYTRGYWSPDSTRNYTVFR